MNPYTQQTHLKSASRGLLKSLGNKSQRFGRWWSGVPKGSTLGAEFAQRPIPTAGKTLLGPEFKYRKPILRTSLMANAGLASNHVKGGWDNINDQLKGAIEGTGIPFEEDTYNRVRNQIMGDMTSTFSKSLWNKFKGVLPFAGAGANAAADINRLAESSAKEKLYGNVIRRNILPSVRKTLQDPEWNPYNKKGLSKYITHPAYYAGFNTATGVGKELLDKGFEMGGIDTKLTSPIAGMNNDELRSVGTSALSGAVERLGQDKNIPPEARALIQDPNTLDDLKSLPDAAFDQLRDFKPPVFAKKSAEDPNYTVGSIGDGEGLQPTAIKSFLGRTVIPAVTNTLGKKHINPFDVMHGVSAIGNSATGLLPASPTKEHMNRRLVERAQEHTPTNFDFYPGATSMAVPSSLSNNPSVTVGAPRDRAQPGITAHEIGHVRNFNTPLMDLYTPSAMSSHYLGTANALLTPSRFDLTATNKNRESELAENAKLGLSAAQAVAGTPMVAEEARASTLGAKEIYDLSKDDPMITPYDKGKAMGAAYSGLPSYIGGTYGPLYEALLAKKRKRDAAAASTSDQ